MAKKYYRWKDENCNGLNPEWVEMTGTEFYAFTKNPENQTRYFMVLDNRICEDADIITMECTYEKYKEWKTQKNREEYLDRYAIGRNSVSLFSEIEDTELTYEEIIADETVDIEEALFWVIKQNLLKAFFKDLRKKEKDLLRLLYFENKDLNELEICKKYGIPQKTLNNRKLSIRKKLKNFLAKNGF